MTLLNNYLLKPFSVAGMYPRCWWFKGWTRQKRVCCHGTYIQVTMKMDNQQYKLINKIVLNSHKHHEEKNQWYDMIKNQNRGLSYIDCRINLPWGGDIWAETKKQEWTCHAKVQRLPGSSKNKYRCFKEGIMLVCSTERKLMEQGRNHLLEVSDFDRTRLYSPW